MAPDRWVLGCSVSGISSCRFLALLARVAFLHIDGILTVAREVSRAEDGRFPKLEEDGLKWAFLDPLAARSLDQGAPPPHIRLGCVSPVGGPPAAEDAGLENMHHDYALALWDEEGLGF